MKKTLLVLTAVLIFQTHNASAESVTFESSVEQVGLLLAGEEARQYGVVAWVNAPDEQLPIQAVGGLLPKHSLGN